MHSKQSGEGMYGVVRRKVGDSQSQGIPRLRNDCRRGGDGDDKLESTTNRQSNVTVL